jgi:DNA-binding NarL/FixJ family response regulator
MGNVLAGKAEKLGLKAVLLTADPATGEAIAFACGRRGVEVTVTDAASAADVASTPGGVVVIDGRSAHNTASPAYLRSLRGNGVRRVVAIGAATGGTVDLYFDAFVGLDAGIDELIAAIGGTVRSRPRPAVAVTSDLEQLTPREREVMALLLAGLGVDAMGAQLGIAANTVRTHLQNVLAKLDMTSRAEAAAWALRAGLEPAEVALEAAT